MEIRSAWLVEEYVEERQRIIGNTNNFSVSIPLPDVRPLQKKLKGKANSLERYFGDKISMACRRNYLEYRESLTRQQDALEIRSVWLTEEFVLWVQRVNDKATRCLGNSMSMACRRTCLVDIESHWQRNKIFRIFDQHDVSKGLSCGDRERERER